MTLDSFKINCKVNDIDGKLKSSLQKGLSRPTKHKEIITLNDLEKITFYLPVFLLQFM
jgi:hypothetical protein